MLKFAYIFLVLSIFCAATSNGYRILQEQEPFEELEHYINQALINHHFIWPLDEEFKAIANIECDGRKGSSQQHQHITNNKFNDDMFEIKLSVKQFNLEELNVQVVGREVVVSARHQNTEDSYLGVKEFNMMFKRFELPLECRPEDVEVILSNDGILTIQAPRYRLPIKTVPIEVAWPIKKIYDNVRKDVRVKDTRAEDNIKMVPIEVTWPMRNINDNVRKEVRVMNTRVGDDIKMVPIGVASPMININDNVRNTRVGGNMKRVLIGVARPMENINDNVRNTRLGDNMRRRLIGVARPMENINDNVRNTRVGDNTRRRLIGVARPMENINDNGRNTRVGGNMRKGLIGVARPMENINDNGRNTRVGDNMRRGLIGVARPMENINDNGRNTRVGDNMKMGVKIESDFNKTEKKN